MSIKLAIFAALALTSISSHAKFLTPISNYILESGKVVMLQSVNEARGTAWYYDNKFNKRVKVDLSEASKETKKKINGIGKADYVYAITDLGSQICLTYHVFENGMASIGCRIGQIPGYVGTQKYKTATYSTNTNNLLASVDEVDGFSINETVTLNGREVRILALYSNGYALTEAAYIFSELDKTKTIVNKNIEITTTRNLEKL